MASQSDATKIPNSEAIEIAQDRLLMAFVTFPVGVTIAWFTALFGTDKYKGTISEMCYDITVLPGKAFLLTTIITTIALLTSNYQYYLENAIVRGACERCCKQLRNLSAIAFLAVGLVPVHQVWYAPKDDDDQTSFDKDALEAATIKIHLLFATVAFFVFAIAELHTLCLHHGLSLRERAWRSWACALIFACFVLFGLNHLHIGGYEATSRAWTFRFEMLIGNSFVWQCQLIWNFSRKGDDFWNWPLSTVGLLLVFGIDAVVRRGQTTQESHTSQTIQTIPTNQTSPTDQISSLTDQISIPKEVILCAFEMLVLCLLTVAFFYPIKWQVCQTCNYCPCLGRPKDGNRDLEAERKAQTKYGSTSHHEASNN